MVGTGYVDPIIKLWGYAIISSKNIREKIIKCIGFLSTVLSYGTNFPMQIKLALQYRASNLARQF